jgi:hypothetical protein
LACHSSLTPSAELHSPIQRTQGFSVRRIEPRR